MHRSNITVDASPSDVTTDNENKHNSSEEAWTDVNLNEDGDTIPITNQREDPRNIHNIAHSRGKISTETITASFDPLERLTCLHTISIEFPTNRYMITFTYNLQ